MTGGIDLSVGSVAALGSVIAAHLSSAGPTVAILGAVAVGVGAGLINGSIIAGFRIQPFIVTLAMLLAARGLAFLLSDNDKVSIDFDHGFKDLDRETFGPVPLRVAIVIVAYLIGSVLLNLTRFGRHVLALGGNEEAARLAGLPVARTTVTVYALSGGLAGLAGVLLAWQTSSGAGDFAMGWELSAIAAVVVGGTLLTGGVGSVGTTLFGVMLLGFTFTVLNFEGISAYWQTVVRGLFLLIVVVLQSRLALRRGAGTS